MFFGLDLAPQQHPPFGHDDDVNLDWSAPITAAQAVTVLLGPDNRDQRLFTVISQLKDDDPIFIFKQDPTWLFWTAANTPANYGLIMNAFATLDRTGAIGFNRRDMKSGLFFMFLDDSEAVAVRARVKALHPNAFGYATPGGLFAPSCATTYVIRKVAETRSANNIIVYADDSWLKY